MMKDEAVWIGEALLALPADLLSPCLNLGSSTEAYRKIEQPWIDQNIIALGETRGIRFIHADIKKAPGVDLGGDIFDPVFQAQLAGTGPRSILCCNMFEHVYERQKLANVCTELLPPGGFIIVSVPRSHPYHLDPIDTYFRPTPEEIADLFSECAIVKSDIVTNGTYFDEISGLSFVASSVTFIKSIIHFFLPFYKWDRWKARFHPLLWLFRRYSVSIVVLRRNVQ